MLKVKSEKSKVKKMKQILGIVLVFGIVVAFMTPPQPLPEGDGRYFNGADSINPKQTVTAVVLLDTIRSAKSPADSISTARGFCNYKYIKGTFKNLSASSNDTLKFFYVTSTGDTTLAGFYRSANTGGVPDTMLVLGTGTTDKTKTVWMDTPFPFSVLATKVSRTATSGVKCNWEMQNDK